MSGELRLLAERLLSPEGLALAGLVAVVLFVMLGLALRRARQGAVIAENQRDLEERIVELLKVQAEMNGRIQQMGESMGAQQAEMRKGLSERLDGLGHRLGQSLSETTRSTHENLTKLHERLAVIDGAQRTISELSGQVGQLQQILSDKQTRGAFGQARMEAIIRDGLPTNAYSFQATLQNGKRPDCLILFPNGAPGLVIDAKFPLEAWNAIRGAKAEEAMKMAETRFRRDVLAHVVAIRDRYLGLAETQDTAFMFVPSESVFADIHERFEDIVQVAHRARVVIVSPSLLMLSIQVVQAILKDARMREQAHLIRDEVAKLSDDVRRLDDRTRKLQAHFSLAVKDVDEILVSTRKVASRGARIEAFDIAETPQAKTAAPKEREPDLLAGE